MEGAVGEAEMAPENVEDAACENEGLFEHHHHHPTVVDHVGYSKERQTGYSMEVLSDCSTPVRVHCSSLDLCHSTCLRGYYSMEGNEGGPDDEEKGADHRAAVGPRAPWAAAVQTKVVY